MLFSSKNHCRAQVLSIFAIGTICFGCSSKSDISNSTHNYETLARDPRRDAEAAARENVAGLEYLHKGDASAAEAVFKRALDNDITYGPAHNNLGRIYYIQRRFYLAAWEFQYAAKLLPGQPEPKNNLGLVLEAVGKLDEAAQQYDQALSLEKDNPELIGNAARVRVRRGDDDADTQRLLEEVVTKDDRQEWRDWANERLALKRVPTTEPAAQR